MQEAGLSKAEVEIYDLSDLNTACRKLGDSVLQALDSMAQELKQELERLETVRRKRAYDVERCEQAYYNCLSYVDEDGNSPPCTAEYNELVQARKVLQEVEQQIEIFNAQSSAFQQSANTERRSIEDAVAQARRDLETHIDTLLYYLRSHPEEIDGIGGGHHNSRYRSARRELVIRTARGEFDSDMMDFLQPQLINQIDRQSSYLRSPTGYHASHRVRGIHIPENLIWEHRAVNQRRYWEAERLGLTRFTAYG
jgi:hypothetical protein